MDRYQYGYEEDNSSPAYRYRSNEYLETNYPNYDHTSSPLYDRNGGQDFPNSFQRNHRFYSSMPRRNTHQYNRETYSRQQHYEGSNKLPSTNANNNNRARLNVEPTPVTYNSFADYDESGFSDRKSNNVVPDGQQQHQQQHQQQQLPTSSVIVDVNGKNTVLRPNSESNGIIKEQVQSGSCLSGFCCSGPSNSSVPADDDSGFCRPSLLLLLLAVLIVVFICVSAILLYLNYATLRPRPQIIEEPCEKTHCTFGSVCMTDADGRTHCRCPTKCPSTYVPICGTDGITYNNECILRQTSCLKQISIRVKHEYECERPDPCADVRCPFGAKCVPKTDASGHECKCPESCPNLGDHTDSRPVCGSDGNDYANTCELRRAACLAQTEIRVKYQGKCDPCWNIECPEPEVCQLDVDRQPECRCGETCSLEFTPVCGSDGKTYSNDCSLRLEACRSRKPLKTIYRGKCSSGVNPCSSVKCSHGEECVINKYGIANCECPSSCEPILRPVCGTDKKTYDNECELRRAGCVTRTDLQISHTGNCGGQGPCAKHNCQFGGHCVERGGQPQCECPACSTEFNPVCGSDGISYGNECKLRLEACQHRRQISILYNGLCNGCEDKKCEFYATCEVDQNGDAKCVCPSCQNNSGEPVCGTDGQTYESECSLKAHSCVTKSSVTVAYKGDCDSCEGVVCKNGARCEAGQCICPTDCSDSKLSELVCGSNMQTYSNECEMLKASCEQPSHLSPITITFFGDCSEKFSVPFTTAVPVKHNLIEADRGITNNTVMGNREKELCKDVHCDHEAICEVGPDGLPRCSCKFDCVNNAVQANNRPVCASDLKIYPNLCAMKLEACRKQHELRLRPLELCEGMEVKPCNGEAPLIDPVTKLEYNCGPVVPRRDCPAGSYCHHTRNFAKCCRKDLNTLFENCADSWFGCCPDGKTAAQGPDEAGCPSLCGCNKLGSLEDSCDNETGQCKCKPGVGGVKCDRCLPGFWGLPKISEGHNGCLPCDCSPLGSIRDDCEQMTGRCVCNPSVQGQKCTVCTQVDRILTANGCVTEAHATEVPIKRSTSHRFTEPEAISSPLYKSTRHLLLPDPRVVYSEGQQTSAGFNHMISDTSYPLPWNTVYHVNYRPTPATIHITALLGDLCEISADCGVPHSVCQRGSCVCPNGYQETPDRQLCMPHSLYTSSQQREYEIPSFDGRAYIQLKKLKAYNKLTIEIEFKSYAYDGILMYSQQKADGTGDFVSLAVINGFVEFRYNLGNGAVVLTTPEKIELKRFHRVVAKRYHRDGLLKLDNLEDVGGQSLGTLKSLDLEEDAFIGTVPTNVTKVFENIGTRQGLLGCIRKLKLGRHISELHIGHDPLIEKVEGVTECGENPCSMLPCNNSGTCFAIDSERYKCTCKEEYTGDHCETWLNPCLTSPCGFGSTCDPQSGGGFTCHCAPGRNGTFCETYDVSKITKSACTFHGSSYVEFPRLDSAARSLSLEMWLRVDAHVNKTGNQLVLYNGQLANGKGDFLALSLSPQNHVIFQFDLGSGPASISSSEPLRPGMWHSVKVSRQDREGFVQIDQGPITAGSSGSPLNELNLELPLYLGGVPPGFETNKEVRTVSGFEGSIQRLVVNGQAWEDLCSTSFNAQGVSHYSGPPCNNTCLHGATCVPLLNNFTCMCQPGFNGESCEFYNKEVGVSSAAKFTGDFYLEYPYKTKNNNFTNLNHSYSQYLVNYDEYEEVGLYDDEDDMYDNEDPTDFFTERRKVGEYSTRIELIFRTSQSNSLIIWLGRGKPLKLDKNYLSIGLLDGYVVFTMSNGRQKSVLKLQSKVWVADNKWHALVAHRRKRKATLQVDGEDLVQGTLGSITYGIQGRMFVGGTSTLPPEFSYSFSGCVESLKVDKKPLDLFSMGRTIETCAENDI